MFVQIEVLPLVGYNQKEPYVHVLLLAVSIVVVHLHALLPVFSQLRQQEVAAVVHALILTTADLLPEARVLIRLRQQEAVVVAVRLVAEVAVAAVVLVVAVVAAVVQVDADK